MAFTIEVGRPAADAEDANLRLVRQNGYGNETANAQLAYKRRDIPPARFQGRIREIAWHAGVRPPERLAAVQGSEPCANLERGCAHARRDDRPAVLAQLHVGEVVGKQAAGLFQDHLVQPRRLQRAGQGRAHRRQGVGLFSLFLVQAFYLLCGHPSLLHGLPGRGNVLGRPIDTHHPALLRIPQRARMVTHPAHLSLPPLNRQVVLGCIARHCRCAHAGGPARQRGRWPVTAPGGAELLGIGLEIGGPKAQPAPRRAHRRLDCTALHCPHENPFGDSELARGLPRRERHSCHPVKYPHLFTG